MNVDNTYANVVSQEDFNRARHKAFIQSIIGILKPHKYDLLSLDEVKRILSPRTEAYRGIQAVDINKIIGSEGRYRDFNRIFLPKHNHLRPRWLNIDKLYLSNIILPPIQLYEIGGVYFVRDGNHRVSVARSQGMDMIDAEVIQLDSIITITPKMDKIELMEAVIGYEKERFEQKTKFSSLISDYSLNFTSTGRYNEVLFHILEHKYYLNEDYDYELSLDIAVISWFNNVYMPIIEVIKNYNLLIHFPDRTEGDLYVWIAKHWHTLKEKYGENIEIHQAASDIVQSKGMKPLQVMRYYLRKIFCGKHTHE